MANALVSWSLELLQSQAGRTVGIVELLGAHARIPLRLERRRLATDFFKTHAIRTRVGAGIARQRDRTSSHDLRQGPYAVVVRGLAHVECFIEHLIHGRLERSNEGSRDIFNMHNWSPRRAVRFQVDFPGSECPGVKIVQDYIESQPR